MPCIRHAGSAEPSPLPSPGVPGEGETRVRSPASAPSPRACHDALRGIQLLRWTRAPQSNRAASRRSRRSITARRVMIAGVSTKPMRWRLAARCLPGDRRWSGVRVDYLHSLFRFIVCQPPAVELGGAGFADGRCRDRMGMAAVLPPTSPLLCPRVARRPRHSDSDCRRLFRRQQIATATRASPRDSPGPPPCGPRAWRLPRSGRSCRRSR
jgi:hypothetical protein